MNKKQFTRWLIILAVAIVVIDQVVKFAVKLNMQIGEEIPLIGSWCRLHFTENEGFAFGTTLGGTTGKIILSIFRMAAAVFVAWLVARLVRRNGKRPLILSLTMIAAGALGNIIDSCFYGLIFSDSYYHVATLFPPEGGYAPFLQGKVVDMFYFPLFQFDWPSWIPFVGGKHFEFFNAIFNVADSAISIGVIWIVLQQFFPNTKLSESRSSKEKENKE